MKKFARAILALVTAGGLGQAQITTSDLVANYDAGLDTDGNAVWVDAVSGGTVDDSWSLSGVGYGSVTSSGTSIRKAFTWSGGSASANLSTLSGNSGSYEVWLHINPADYANGDDAVIFERGGSNGSSLVLSKHTTTGAFSIVYAVASGSSNERYVSAPLSAATLSDFFQVVAVNDQANNQIRLYVNGTLAGTHAGDPSASAGTYLGGWCIGTDGAGLGSVNSSFGAASALGLAQDDQNDNTGFRGQIALFRVYNGASGALTSAGVAQNYSALASGQTQPPPADIPEVQLCVNDMEAFYSDMATTITAWSRANSSNATFSLAYQDLDSSGYPAVMTPGEILYVNNASFAFEDKVSEDTRPVHEGVHVLTWRGDVQIELPAYPKYTDIISSEYDSATYTGRIVFVKHESADGTFNPDFNIQITAGENYAQHPLRDLHIWLPDPANRFEQALEPSLNPHHPFHPLWLEKSGVPEFGVLRFFEPMKGSTSSVIEWGDRTPPYYASWRLPTNGSDHITVGNKEYSWAGMPYEYMIQLCNHTRKHLWITVPYQASNDTITKLAQLIRFGSDENGIPYMTAQGSPVYPPLDPDLRVFLEYSNETWNPLYPCFDYCTQEGKKYYSDNATQRFAARRSCEMFSIFQGVFQNDASRLVRIMSTRTSDPAVTNVRLAEAFTYGAGLNPAARPDVLAVTSYWGGGMQDWIFDNIEYWDLNPQTRQANIDAAYEHMLEGIVLKKSNTDGVDNAGVIDDKHFGYAQDRGIPVIAYEGGIGLPLVKRCHVYYDGSNSTGPYNQNNQPPLPRSNDIIDAWIIRDDTDPLYASTIEAELNKHGALKSGEGDNNTSPLLDFIVDFLNDPQAAEAGDLYLNICKAQGLRMHAQLGSYRIISKYGNWPMFQYLGQENTPRYDFAVAYADEQAEIREIGDAINSAPQFASSGVLPSYRAGVYYDVVVPIVGGDGSVAADWIGGFLPAGLECAQVSNGIRISGTPTDSSPTASPCAFMIRLLDGDKDPGWKVFSFEQLGGYYRIVNKASRKVLTADESGTYAALLANASSSNAQKWAFLDWSGSLKIAQKSTSRVLEGYDAAAIEVYGAIDLTDPGAPGNWLKQQWSLIATDEAGYFTLRNEKYKRFLEGATASPFAVSLGEETLADNQKWSFQYVEPAPSGLLVEAEDGSSYGAAIKTAQSGYTGSGYLLFNAAGSYVDLTFETAGNGLASLDLRYATPNSGVAVKVAVNGVVANSQLAMPSTGGWGGNQTWGNVFLSNIPIKTGSNTFRIESVGAASAHFDSLKISDVLFPAPAQASSTVLSVSAANRIAWFSFDTDTRNADATLAAGLVGNASIYGGGGQFAGAAHLGGGSDAVQLLDHSQFNTGGPYIQRTISFWFSADNAANSSRQLLYEEGGNSRGLNAYLSNGTLYAGGWDSSSGWTGTWKSIAGVTSGQWHHIVIVLNASANPGTPSSGVFRAYLDGIEFDAANSVGMQMGAHSDDGGLGGIVGTSKFHNGTTSSNLAGSIDDLAIWNRALSPAEISALANSQ